jgi:eukaryotic-like serine/threonine-protein kinase
MAHDLDADFIALQAALAGEYSLDREIGRGGMGIVYLAREVRLARPVAIKVLPPTLSTHPGLREAFLGEARLAARLTHPNIVPVYAMGERGGFVYIVMAYVEGITLGDRIRTRGPLLPGQAARMLREVSWALAYAHAAGIVHRDVSAENIVLERGTDRAIVMDFGIASAMYAAAVTDDGRVMGNAHYVSPEQAVGEPVDARSDLYSLGVVGFYALTGRLPFEGESPGDVVTKHLTVPAPAIASVASAVPARLAHAVDRCLAKEPLRRYRNAEAFAEAIDQAFEHAKEIPAPLRVWIAKGEKESAPRAILTMWGTVLGVFVAVKSGNPWFFPVPLLSLGALSYIPFVTRLRRVLRDGYVVDDLHAALKEHALVRSEEIEYERSQQSSSMLTGMKVLFGGSVVSGLAFAQLMQQAATTDFAAATRFGVGLSISLSTLTLSSVSLIGDFVRLRLSAKTASLSISFWKSPWGVRLARVAGVGVNAPPRPVLGMPMLTEIALGRATDLLFQALPKSSRRELAALPEVVRQLEADAGKLRGVMEELDGQLVVFDRVSDALTSEVRRQMADEIRATRAQAAERLAATVAALENIRLDLLRLQMGSTGLESVTASLEAARRIGDQIGDSVLAQDAVESLLRDVRTLPPASPLEHDHEGETDDDDTPVSGVPAASG